MNFLPIIFKLIARRDDILAIWKAIQPLMPLIQELLNGIKPDLEAPATPISFDMRWVQETLNLLGETLEINGELDAATEAAVRKFQKAHGLTVDGDPGAVTRAWLHAERLKL